MDTNHVPQTFDDCINNVKHDWLSQKFSLWAERLKKVGRALFFVLIVFGIIISFVSAFTHTETYRGETSFDFIVFLTYLLSYAWYAALEFFAYHILSLLLSAMSSIVMNISLIADIAMLNSQKDGYESYKPVNSKPKHTTYEEE